MPAVRNKTWTEYEICQRLRKKFPAPAYIVLPQVRNGTGYAGGRFARQTVRTADALIFSTWPGRGLWIGGVEIKTYLADWNRELADAPKSEIQQWCKYWWIAAPAGLIPRDELPETWGLIECDEAKTRIAVKAPAVEPKPPDMLLFSAVMRAMQENYTHKDEVKKAAEELSRQRVSEAEYRFDQLRSDVDAYQKATGISISDDLYGAEHLGETVKLIRDLGLLNGRTRLKKLHEEAQEIVASCQKLLEVPNG